MLLGARQFFERRGAPTPSVPTARDYVQDGLIAMWDGIENAGWGVHDTAATTWKDLIGNLNLQVNNSATWGENCLSASTRLVSGLAYSSSYITSAIGTIEACFDMRDDQDNGQGRGLVCNGNSRSVMGYGIFGIRSRGEASVQMASVTPKLIDLWSASIVYEASASYDTIYFNGIVQTTESAAGNWNVQNHMRIGNNGISERTAVIGKAHVVRIYSRALTAAEIAANYAIDKARFNLP